MPLIFSLGGKEKQNSSVSFFLLQVNYNFLEFEINTNEPSILVSHVEWSVAEFLRRLASFFKNCNCIL